MDVVFICRHDLAPETFPNSNCIGVAHELIHPKLACTLGFVQNRANFDALHSSNRVKK